MAIILLKMKESNTFSQLTLNGRVGLSLRLTHGKCEIYTTIQSWTITRRLI